MTFHFEVGPRLIDGNTTVIVRVNRRVRVWETTPNRVTGVLLVPLGLMAALLLWWVWR